MSVAAGPTPAGDLERPEAGSGRPLRLGFLTLGRPESGVRRYSQMLAHGMAARSDVVLTQADAGLLEGRAGGLGRRGAQLAGTDVVQLQWNRRGWGRGPRGAYRFVDFQRHCRRPLVVTVHDIPARESFRERWLDTDVLNLRLVGRRADRLVVHSQVEVDRLQGLVPPGKIRVVPHFVEDLALPLTPAEARARLGLADRRVITLLGFIFGRKGHRTLLDAIPRLPPDILVVFAGASIAGRVSLGDRLRQRAAELGLGPERVLFTGYLSDDDFLTWVAATHLAVLPFRDLSASGSLSTWIAAGKPILASDLPGFREYDALAPGALRLFSPIEPEALATAITAQLDAGLPDLDPALRPLAEALSVPRTVARYLDVDREVAPSA